MDKELFSLDKYGLFTFNTTSHALKAEKVLKSNHEEIIVIPTLREISASCGLSIKFRLHEWARLYQILKNNNVSVEDIYSVEKQKGRHSVDKLDPGQVSHNE